MKKIFKYIQKKKGKPIPITAKILFNLPLNEKELFIDYLDIRNPIYDVVLPENLFIHKNLCITNANLMYYPASTIVCDNIYIDTCVIHKLPNNLIANNNLFIINSQLNMLPDNLIVYGDLFLTGSSITNVPINLKVYGDLHIRKTPLAELIRYNRNLFTNIRNCSEKKFFF